MLPNLALADMVAGLNGAIAVMVALWEVKVNGGRGQSIDLPLFDPAALDPGPARRQLPADGREPEAPWQPIRHGGAAQRLSDQGRRLGGDVGLDPGHVGAGSPARSAARN